MRVAQLTAIRFRKEGHQVVALCRCTCGREKWIRWSSVTGGDVKSCGCFRRQRITAMNRKHGDAHTATGRPSAEWVAWRSMRQRCEDPRVSNYAAYGGRGITVCSRWQKFENFLADMGRRPSAQHSLDRKNNERGYSPDNCRWATRSEQAKNRRERARNALGQFN